MPAKAVRGKDGVLFLDNDTNAVMSQITGRMKASRQSLAEIAAAQQERRRLCDELGITYRHVVCPNKESVETDKLPPPFVYEQFGPTVLRQYLEAFPADRPFYDRDILRGRDGAYFRTDSHWTEIGAVAYFAAALNHFGDERALACLERLQAVPAPIQRRGDLGITLNEAVEEAQGLLIPAPQSVLLFDGSIPNEGHIRFQRSADPAVAGTKALVLHDSFTNFLYRFICECYEEILFVHGPDLDPRFLAHYKPDVLWFFQVERFLPRVPRNNVELLAAVAEHERRKGLPAHGSLFLQEHWPAAFVRAPEESAGIKRPEDSVRSRSLSLLSSFLRS